MKGAAVHDQEPRVSSKMRSVKILELCNSAAII